MRVTHVITRLVIGGAQENTVATVLGLNRLPGWQVDLISGRTIGPEGTLTPLFHDSPGFLTELPSLVRAVHPLRDWLAFRQLTQVFRSTKPDIVHTHSGKAGILGRLAAHRAGVPIILHTIHGPSFGPFQGVLPNLIFTEAERTAGRVTSHFVSVSQAMTDQYLAAGIGRPEIYTRIYSGFELEPFLSAKNDPALRRRLKIAEDDIVVGKIARLFKLKGHDDLIAAAGAAVARNSRLKFLLIGDGTWRRRLEEKVVALGLREKFIFTGLVPPGEIPQYLRIMDMLVHLSRREGLARALPQALAASRPVIAYDCDGANEVCLPEKTGFLITAGDLRQLTERILELAGNRELRERLGRNGRDLVRDSFSVETMIKRIGLLYQRLTEAASK